MRIVKEIADWVEAVGWLTHKNACKERRSGLQRNAVLRRNVGTAFTLQADRIRKGFITTKCRIPGVMFNSHVKPGSIRMTVKFPKDFDVTEEVAKQIQDDLRDYFEQTLVDAGYKHYKQ